MMYQKIRSYKKELNAFSKKFCSRGQDMKYFKLLKDYRGNGYYIPRDDQGEVVFEAIENNMYLFDQKIKFIEEIEQKLSAQKSIPNYSELTLGLKKNLELILDTKKRYFLSLDVEEKAKIVGEFHSQYRKFQIQFKKLVEGVYFLKSFNFPVDHLQNRANYERLKFSEDKKEKRQSYSKYFRRRILEDGTTNHQGARSDIFLRTTIDTVFLALQKNYDIFPDDLRANIDWILIKLKSYLEQNRNQILNRIKNWKDKTIKAKKFYLNLLKNKKSKEIQGIIAEKNQSSQKLKRFVYDQQARVYQYWTEKSEIMRKLYVLDTILFNEVGPLDADAGYERSDVIQVVLNRVVNKKYNYIPEKQGLYDYLAELKVKPKKYPWLNTLFKEGEFSFTYFYIAAVSNIFCPDQSPMGKRLRERNLKIILKKLEQPDPSFDALRYFSQVSMLGKINMTQVWDDYRPYPERPGWKIEADGKLALYYKTNRYRFLYTYKDPKGITYAVIEIDDKKYATTLFRGRVLFFEYRNPYLFRYFSPVK